MKSITYSMLLEYQTDAVVSITHNSLLLEAQQKFTEGDYSGSLSLLRTIPTKGQLYAELMEKLKGKRVYKTLHQIAKGSIKDRHAILKATSSLFTHAVIECEKGNTQFERVLPQILDTLNRLAYKG